MATSTTSLSDIAPRLVRLFGQAGIFVQADIEQYHEKHTSQKSITDILKQDVSLDSFHDLFTYEIRIPFKSKKEKSNSLSSQLTAPAVIRLDELRQMLAIHRPAFTQLIPTLESSGAMPAGRMSVAISQAEHFREDPYAWLVKEEVLTHEVMETFLKSPSNPLTESCALVLAFSVLESNQLIPTQKWEQLHARLAIAEGAKALTELRREVKLSPADLLEKIEGGLYLRDVNLASAAHDPGLLALFPASLIRRELFVPLFQDEHRIGIAISDPLNLELAILIRLLTNKWAVPYFAPSGAIVDWLNAPTSASGITQTRSLAANGSPVAALSQPVMDGHPKESTSKIEPLPIQPVVDSTPPPPVVPETKAPARGKGSKKAAPAAVRPKEAEKAPETARPMAYRAVEAPTDSGSAVQFVSSLIENAIELRATDIHLEPTRTQLSVRFRIDGRLTRIMNLPANLVSPVTSRIKVLANMDVTERRRPQDGHIMLNIDSRRFDFRIATMPTIFGEKLAIRVLDSARVMTGLKDLGMNPKQEEATLRMIRHTFGIVVVTGPTGSGKTSTLYAALNELNSENRHLVTIEDPVEYQLDGINQVQVDLHTGMTFSEGLRATLRQDPDIIMVGEIRDSDTAMTAIRAALTGHLVFSTLHTNSALGAFQALNQLGASPFLVGSAVTGVIAQRLVRRLCEACKKPKPVAKALSEQLGISNGSKLKLHRAAGCPECLTTGYAGRLAIFEVVEMTEPLRNAVLENLSPARMLEVADAEGRISIRDAGLEKVKEGATSPEELIERVILDS